MYKALDQSIRDSDKLAELSDFAYRVWAQGLAASDMVGRLTASPKKFWAQAMPLIPYDEAKIKAAFVELKSLIHFYEVDGKPYMVFHEHEDYNKGTKNLKYQHPSKIPPPSPSLCYCVAFTKQEEGGGSSNGRYKDPVTADVTAVPTASVHVPSHVPVHVHVPEEDGGVEEGEEWPPLPATPRGHLWKLFGKAKITGTLAQRRQYFEAWLAQAGAQRLEQILMEPRVIGKDVFVLQRWYFNDMLKEAK